ncbi:MAG TPA: hypothetical protein PK280_02845 [Planctomycetota bacterium]|nr:hypothetical protein [Planctomycetota bacterium]
MSKALTAKDVEALLAGLRQAAPREECWRCDCLQGFLTQIELDAEPAAAALIAPLKVPAGQMHGCLGCAPCPPGAAFADYLRGLNQSAGG